MKREGICTDMYDEGCPLKGQIQLIDENDDFVCQECGDRLSIVAEPLYKKLSNIAFSWIGLGVFIALLAIGGAGWWFSQPDTTAPDKPILLSKSKTYTDTTKLKIKGESGCRIYLNDNKLEQKINSDGEATIEVSTNYDIGIIKQFSIYLQDDANNSSEKLEVDIEKIDKPDTDIPNAPIVKNIPTINIDDSKTDTIETTVEVRGEIGTTVLVNGEDSHIKISNSGVAMVDIEVTLDNIDKNFVIKLRDASGNESDGFSFKFNKHIIDTTPPSKPIITPLPTTTVRDSVTVEIKGEDDARIFVNNDFIGEHIKDGKKEITLDTSGELGEKKFSIYLQDHSSNNSEPLEFVITKEKDKDKIAPSKPRIISSIPKEYYCNTYSLELGGEIGSDIYINGKNLGVMDENGKAVIDIDISKQSSFDITLKDNAQNESETTSFSLNKAPTPNTKTVEGYNFVFVPNCRQEVKYQIEPYLTFRKDMSKSIYTKKFIETKKPFYIQSVPVTIKQFGKFVKETNYTPDGIKKGKAWNKDEHGETNPNYPVTNVSSHDIEKYIEWFSKKSGKHYRLPTVKEWIITINQNLIDNDNFALRQEVNIHEKKIRHFIRSLYEYSSTGCKGGMVLLASDYITDIEYVGKKRCEGKIHQFVTFRLLEEIE